MEKMYFNGQDYELAPKTMKIARQIEKTEASATITEAYRNEYETLKLALGSEAVSEILGTGNLEEINLNELVMAYNAMVTGYDSPLEEMQRMKEEELLSSPSIKAISNMAKDIRAIGAMQEQKQFLQKK